MRIHVLLVAGLLLLTAPSSATQPDEYGATDEAGDQLVPLDNYDMRELRLAGDGSELVVSFRTTDMVEDLQGRTELWLTFASPASLPGYPHSLGCRVGWIGTVGGLDPVCTFRVVTDVQSVGGVDVVDIDYHYPMRLLDTDAATLTVALDYAWFFAEPGHELRGMRSAASACVTVASAFACTNVDDNDGIEGGYVLP